MESKEKIIAEMFHVFYQQNLKPAISIENTAVVGEYIQMAHSVVGQTDLSLLKFSSEFTELTLQPEQVGEYNRD